MLAKACLRLVYQKALTNTDQQNPAPDLSDHDGHRLLLFALKLLGTSDIPRHSHSLLLLYVVVIFRPPPMTPPSRGARLDPRRLQRQTCEHPRISDRSCILRHLPLLPRSTWGGSNVEEGIVIGLQTMERARFPFQRLASGR
jgi:hypothetical protein